MEMNIARIAPFPPPSQLSQLIQASGTFLGGVVLIDSNNQMAKATDLLNEISNKGSMEGGKTRDRLEIPKADGETDWRLSLLFHLCSRIAATKFK